MQIQTKIDGKCVKEYCKKNTIIWSIIFSLSFIYCAVFITIFAIKGYWNSVGFMVTVVVAIITIASCGLFFFKLRKAIKTIDKNSFDAIYDFEDEQIIRRAILNNEQVSEIKIKYSDIAYYIVSKYFIFLVLFNRNYFPIDKNNQLEELLKSKNIKRK